MSLQQCMFEVSSSEFVAWIGYLDTEVNRFHRQDYFLATIAAEIRRSYVKKPRDVKIGDFLLEFETSDVVQKHSAQESKNFWFSALGITKEGE